jgi:hypothetical protein
MTTKNIQGIICLVILFLLANHALAADWVLYSSSNDGDKYYDKSTVKKINSNIFQVGVKNILNKDGKKQIFSTLKSIGKAPASPDTLNHTSGLLEIDCYNETIKISSQTFNDKKGNVIFSLNKSSEWIYITPKSSAEALKNKVCSTGKTPGAKKN